VVPPAAGLGAAGLAAADTSAGRQVALGRQAARAEREQRSDLADQARIAGGVSSRTSVTGAAPAVTGAVSAPMSASAANAAPRSAVGVAIACYRIESADRNATWGGERLPLIVSADSATRAGAGFVAVLDDAGRPTQIRARWTGRPDSLLLRLQRLGYSGSIALGPDVGGRTGVASTAPAAAAFEQVVVVGMGAEERDASKRAPTSTESAARPDASAPTDGARADAAKARAPAVSAAPPLPAGGPRPAESAAAVSVRVTMRPIACPGR